MSQQIVIGVFKDALAKAKAGRKGVVKAIRVPAPNEKLTRKVLDGLDDAERFKPGIHGVLAGFKRGAQVCNGNFGDFDHALTAV